MPHYLLAKCDRYEGTDSNVINYASQSLSSVVTLKTIIVKRYNCIAPLGKQSPLYINSISTPLYYQKVSSVLQRGILTLHCTASYVILFHKILKPQKVSIQCLESCTLESGALTGPLPPSSVSSGPEKSILAFQYLFSSLPTPMK